MKNGKYNVINGWSNLLGTWWVLFSTKKLNENMGSAIKVRNLVLWKLVIKNFSESEKVFIEDLALELRSEEWVRSLWQDGTRWVRGLKRPVGLQ